MRLKLLGTAASVAVAMFLATSAFAQSALAPLKDQAGKEVGAIDLIQTQAGVLPPA